MLCSHHHTVLVLSLCNLTALKCDRLVVTHSPTLWESANSVTDTAVLTSTSRASVRAGCVGRKQSHQEVRGPQHLHGHRRGMTADMKDNMLSRYARVVSERLPRCPRLCDAHLRRGQKPASETWKLKLQQRTAVTIEAYTLCKVRSQQRQLPRGTLILRAAAAVTETCPNTDTSSTENI